MTGSGWFGKGRQQPPKTPLEAIRRAERKHRTPAWQRVDAGVPGAGMGRRSLLVPWGRRSR